VGRILGFGSERTSDAKGRALGSFHNYHGER
jgi:hypothetical protein